MKRIIYLLAIALAVVACSKDEPTPKAVTPEAVDLGLSVKWATFNVGADDIGDYGGLYGWGDSAGNHKSLDGIEIEYHDTEGYVKVDWTSPYYGGLTPPVNIGGTARDVASYKWGSQWRTPTTVEMQELMDKCTWTADKVGNTVGLRATGPNGNSIFMPLGGIREDGSSVSSRGTMGCYWTSTLISKAEQKDLGFDCSIACAAYSVSLPLMIHGPIWSHTLRAFGLSIRPVTDK